VAGGAAVVGDDQAGDVYRLEVGQMEAGEALEVVVVPAGVGSADEAAAHAVVGEDDAVVAESGDDGGGLRAGGGAGRRDDRGFEAVDLAGGAGHGAAGRRGGLRNLALGRNRAPARCATAYARGFRGGPDPII